MKKRLPNAAQFVSLRDGWPEYDYRAYAAVEFALSYASAAPPVVWPRPALIGCPQCACPRR